MFSVMLVLECMTTTKCEGISGSFAPFKGREHERNAVQCHVIRSSLLFPHIVSDDELRGGIKVCVSAISLSLVLVLFMLPSVGSFFESLKAICPFSEA